MRVRTGEFDSSGVPAVPLRGRIFGMPSQGRDSSGLDAKNDGVAAGERVSPAETSSFFASKPLLSRP